MEKVLKDKTLATPLLGIFSNIAQQTGAFWLDSSLTFDDRGGGSFIGRKPHITISVENNQMSIVKKGQSLTLPADMFFDYLTNLVENENLFAVGYFSYEATLPYLNIVDRYQSLLPQIHFQFYQSVLEVNHTDNKMVATNPEFDDYQDLISYENSYNEGANEIDSGNLLNQIDPEKYFEKIRTIKNYIKEGDIYQANYTNRFEIKSSAKPYDVYKQLRILNPAPYSAFINSGQFQILSSSPERMFLKNGSAITSSPIKGTITRGRTPDDENKNLQKLLDSTKDKAELLMIVDLVRNDLGKIANAGAVQVDELFKPEIYSSLIHLVADISARLKPDSSLRDIIESLLPGGSITGAPKKRAVEIINNIEDSTREIYTGCIGYFHRDKADFNIAIRTIYKKDDSYYLHAGGGIVADSEPESEYHEMMLKANNLIRALGIQL